MQFFVSLSRIWNNRRLARSEFTTADSSPILKLIDAFEEWFEWLTLTDLRSLRQTCKLLKQVVDKFIRTNCSAVKIVFLVRFGLIRKTLKHFRQLDLSRIGTIKEVTLHADELIEQEMMKPLN